VLESAGLDGQLARRVGSGLGQRAGRRRARLVGSILERGGAGVVRLEPPADQPLVLLGLGKVKTEHLGQLRIAGLVHAGLELRDRVLLRRMHVGEVLDELLLHCVQ
jgi:hypothetical protein